MKQQNEPKPLTAKERREGLIILSTILILGVVVFGLINLLFPIN